MPDARAVDGRNEALSYLFIVPTDADGSPIPKTQLLVFQKTAEDFQG